MSFLTRLYNVLIEDSEMAHTRLISERDICKSYLTLTMLIAHANMVDGFAQLMISILYMYIIMLGQNENGMDNSPTARLTRLLGSIPL
jgi:hypothetical protein